MKKRTALFLLIIVTLFAACSTDASKNQEPREITGKIIMVGNEPFAHLALDLGYKNITLKAEKQVYDELTRLQGNQVTIYYEKIETAPDGDFINIIKYKKN